MGRFSWLATSSDSEPEFEDGAFYGPETKGFVDRCFYCNATMIVESESDPDSIGRLKFKCPNEGDGLTLHETKWWDESVTEEIETIKARARAQEDTLKAVTVTNEGESIDHSEMFNRLRVVEGSVLSLREEIEKCRKDLADFKEEFMPLLKLI